MWLHYFIFIYILASCMIFCGIYKNNKLFISTVFLLFFILAAFRNVSVGNDTVEYYRIFNLISKQTDIMTALTATRYEIGYIALNFIVSRFTTNFNVLLAIIAAIYLLSVVRFINKYSEYYSMTVILFFTMSSYYVLMNIERQCIAVAIILYAVPFLEQKKYVKYIASSIFASLFQSVAVIFILLIFLPRINMAESKQVFKWILLCFAGIIIISFSVQRILVYLPYYQHYLNESMYGNGGVRSASLAFFCIRIFSLLLVYAVGGFHYQKHSQERSIDLLNKMMFLDCLVAAASISFNMYDRIEGYLCLGFIISITNAINNMKKINNRRIITILMVGVTFAYVTVTLIFRSNWSGIFPYSFM